MSLIKQTKNLFKLFENQELCDTTFIVGEEKKQIKTHRVLLAAISPVFKAMLFGEMKESKMNSEIEIIDVDSCAFESVIKYAYCCPPKLCANNVVAIKQICDRYQILLLPQLCDKALSCCISAQNFCSLLNQSLNAKLSSYVNIIQQKLSRIGSAAVTIVKSVGFLQMNELAMKIFLQSDSLNIKEEHLWESVVKWTEYQTSNASEPANKKQKLNNGSSQANINKNKNKNDPKIALLKSVCPYIRFGFMDGKYFVKKVKPLNILTTQDVADIVCFIQCNDEPCGRFSVKPRAYIKTASKDKMIYYSLRISTEFYGPPNNYSSLITSDLEQGCAADKSSTPWIKATFGRVINVTKIEIGPASKAMAGQWGAAYLKNAILQYTNDKGKWISVKEKLNVQENVIQQINLDVETKAMRVWYPLFGYLGIGCWRIYGFPKQ